VAEQERLRLGERVRLGITRARKEGVRLGRPKADIDLEQATQLRDRGESLRTIATTLGCSTSALQRALTTYQKPLSGDPQNQGEFEAP